MKTHTRRIVKFPKANGFCWNQVDHFKFEDGLWHPMLGGALMDGPSIRCPYGVKGDRLWVRENFALTGVGKTDIVYSADGEDEHEYAGPFKPCIHMPRWASRITLEITRVSIEHVQAISEADAIFEGVACSLCNGRGWYLERFSDNHGTACETCRIEAAKRGLHLHGGQFAKQNVRIAFKELWNALNEPRGFGWEVNPWVWVIEFKRVFDIKDVPHHPILFSGEMVRAILK